jgi:predicted ATP-grasp superfamily ATP-dependent carboligase
MTKINYKTTRNKKANEFLGVSIPPSYSKTQSNKIEMMFPVIIRRQMSEYDIKFIDNLKSFKAKWSDKQIEVLNKIYKKYKTHEDHSSKNQNFNHPGQWKKFRRS